MKVSKRTEELTSIIVMDVLERAKEMERKGVHVIHLEVGEPDFDAPTCVKAAACRALEEGHTHYTHSLGNLDLREAIALYYRVTYGVSVEPDQIIVTSGSSPAILLVFSALLDPGDEVIISEAIGGEGTSTLQNRQPCRPLPDQQLLATIAYHRPDKPFEGEL